MSRTASPETPAGRTGDPSACPCVSRSKHAFGPHGRPSSVPVRDAKPGTSSGRTGGLPTCPTPACSGREAAPPSSGLGGMQHVKLTHVGGGVRQQCVRKNVGRRLRVLTLASTCSVALRLYGSRHCLVLSTIRLHQMESNVPLSKHDDVVIATQRHAAELRHLVINLCEIIVQAGGLQGTFPRRHVNHSALVGVQTFEYRLQNDGGKRTAAQLVRRLLHIRQGPHIFYNSNIVCKRNMLTADSSVTSQLNRGYDAIDVQSI